MILFKKEISDKTYVLGWSHDKLNPDKNGFCQWERISIENIRNQGSSSVLRLSPDVYSGERLARRTAGQPYADPLKFLIAGLGSIGSNLIFFLNSLENPEFRLVDTELLEIENIGRHLLGFESVNMYKTSGIENFIIQKRPHQKVLKSNDSIVDLIQNNNDFVNEVDFIFIAVGPGNIQDWIGRSISQKIITKPVFFIWVEPYLAGGHCVYIHPDSGLDYSSFFDEEGYF